MKRYFILAALFVLLFIQCNRDVIEYDYTFTGKSEHWSAVLMVKGEGVFYEEDGHLDYDSNYFRKFELTYLGSLEEFSSTKTLSYWYDSSSSGGGENRTFEKPPTRKVFTDESHSLHGGAIENPDEVIKVTVQWDDNKETFELRNEQ